MFLIKQFLLINGHFTLNLLVALTCFAVAWLYFDAWLGRRDIRESTKAFGFMFLSLSFVVHSTAIEQSVLSTSIIGIETLDYLTGLFRILAYIILITGQVVDPLQPLPSYRMQPASIIIAGALIPNNALLAYSYPVLAIITAFLYLRRATVGLEHHLKPISYSFMAIALSELVSLASTFRGTDNIALANLVAPFGYVWFFEHFLLVLFMYILGRWVWGYLIKRLETQLLMIFTTSVLMIFLITTVFFTTTSMRNLYQGTLDNLEINVNVLNYSINGKKAESLSDAQLISQNPEIISAVKEDEKDTIANLTTSILLAKKESFSVVVDKNGEVLVRADDPDKVGGSLSDDPLIKKALEGDEASSIVTTDGVIAPQVSVRSSAPIKDGGEIIGAVIVGTAIDNAFVDGLKDATSLDASVYADNVRSATTFIAPDGKSRWVGIKEETEDIKKQVLVDGELYKGSVNILNSPYFASFLPLKDISGQVIGMLFVGQPQIILLQAASSTIELTFLVTAGLLILSVIPAFFVSRYIINQIR